MSSQNDILVGQEGCAGVITLNRAKALNALTDDMRRAVVDALPGYARDAQIYAMVIQSSSPRAFCAGGDVREITELARHDIAAARASFGFEYAMNWALDCFTKPTVSLIDGMVMGSGVGLTLYGTHRVAGPGYTFAMPETAIGLFPDVGVAWALSRLPGHVGRYLGLTGRTIDRADAFRLGLATHCIEADKFDQITGGLAEAEPVDALIDPLHEDPGKGELTAFEDTIRETFAGSTVEEIVSALEKRAGHSSAEADWCRGVADDLSKRAPLSLKVTLSHLKACEKLDLRHTLIRDYRLASRFLDGPDFQEGVRALLVDKDHAPTWSPATLADCSSALVDAYDTLPPGGDLSLATRSEMQSIKS